MKSALAPNLALVVTNNTLIGLACLVVIVVGILMILGRR